MNMTPSTNAAGHPDQVPTPAGLALGEGVPPSMFRDHRPVDRLLFDPVEAEHIQTSVQERVFGDADPVRIGRYTVLEPIGRGGMGVVYAAYDNQLDRKLAVKLMRRGHARGHARIVAEAQAMARLSHPNVVQIHDVGEWQGQVFFAMELVVGATLGQWLADQARRPAEILEVLRAAGKGLAAVHHAGLVHRDFKPDNVVVGDDGRVRVLDFGIARQDLFEDCQVTAPGAGHLGLTETGAFVGTPAYMAPEQFRRETVDVRADQFAFGVVLFEALTGVRPFAGSDVDTLAHAVSHGTRRPTPPGVELPTGVQRVLERALRPRAQDRYESMSALLKALEPPRRRSTKAVLVMGVLLLAACAGFGWHYTGAKAAQGNLENAGTVQERRNAELLEQQQDQTTLTHARALLESDPTMALATLRSLSPNGWSTEARAIATDAAVRGVARRIVHGPAGEPLPGTRGAFVSLINDSQVRIDSKTGERRWIASSDTPTTITAGGTAVMSCCEKNQVDVDFIKNVQTNSPNRFSVHWVAQTATPVTSAADDAIALVDRGVAAIHQVVGPGRAPSIALRGRATNSPLALAVGGKAIAGTNRSNRLMWWDTKGSLVGPKIRGQVQFSADGRWLAAILANGKLAVWRATREGFTAPAVVRGEAIRRYVASPSGEHFATVDSDDQILIWEATTRRSWAVARWGGLAPSDLQFSTDGLVLGGIHDGALRIWNVGTGMGTVLTWPHPVEGWLADEPGEVITLDNLGSIATWDVPWRDLRSARPFDEGTAHIGYSKGALLMGGADGTIRRWDDHALPEVWAELSAPVNALDTHGSRVTAATDDALTHWHEGRRTVRVFEEPPGFVVLDAGSDAASHASPKGGIVRVDLAPGGGRQTISSNCGDTPLGSCETILHARNKARVNTNDWWWRLGPTELKYGDLLSGPAHVWGLPGQPYALLDDGSGVLAVRAANGNTKRAGGFATGGAVLDVQAPGRVFARTADNALSLWLPTKDAKTHLSPSVPEAEPVKVAVSPNEHKLAIGRPSGQVVELSVPAFWWYDVPGSVVDDYTEVVVVTADQ